MEKNNFVTLCLRLMAIYFGVLGLGSFPNALQVFLTSPTPRMFIISPTLYIISGIVLFLSAPRLSRFMIEFGEADNNIWNISASERTTRIALPVLVSYHACNVV